MRFILIVSFWQRPYSKPLSKWREQYYFWNGPICLVISDLIWLPLYNWNLESLLKVGWICSWTDIEATLKVTSYKLLKTESSDYLELWENMSCADASFVKRGRSCDSKNLTHCWFLIFFFISVIVGSGGEKFD